jgi:hypothetical protein
VLARARVAFGVKDDGYVVTFVDSDVLQVPSLALRLV